MTSNPQTLPKDFVKSNQTFGSYPLNLVEGRRWGAFVLRERRDRFEERAQSLVLFEDEATQQIPILEVDDAGTVSDKNLLSGQQLLDWFQADFQNCAKDSTPTCRPDPLYRAVYLISSSSARPLEISPESLKRILTYFQVMPGFLDFLYVYGNPSGMDPELKFSSFRTDAITAEPRRGLVIDALNRSGRRFQVCYTLKSAEELVDEEVEIDKGNEKETTDKAWKIRHGIFHHQFDVGKGTQLWILGDQKLKLWDLSTSEIGKFNNHGKYLRSFSTFSQSFKTSLEMHLLYSQWASVGWRWYICTSEERAHRLTVGFLNVNDAIGIPVGPSTLVRVQEVEEAVHQIIMVLQSNADVMEKVKLFYVDIVADTQFPESQRDDCKKHVAAFVSDMNEIIYDTKMQAERAKVLSTLIKDRKEILIQHLQTQAALRQEKSAQSMEDLAGKSTREAIAVRIIAVITLVFLPATFIATVFSTDMVKYQSDSDESRLPSESRSPLAIERFFEVSLPLMIATFVIAALWYWYEKRRRRKKEEMTASAGHLP